MTGRPSRWQRYIDPFSRSTVAIVSLVLIVVSPSRSQTIAPYLRDRGIGIRTSIFGTYLRPGELLVSPFFEYYLDNNLEYQPSELGYVGETDFRGRYRATEGLMFIGYGVTDWLAIEFEAAVIDARLEKSPSDQSQLPDRFNESGLGDIQAQLDFRFARERANRPEVFGFVEVVFPTPGDRVLIGTSDWELKGGAGLTRGFRWGTMTVRTAVQYSKEEETTEFGEWAVEYLKRLSPRWRIYAGVEGFQDEVELIGEAQWHPSHIVFLRFNVGLGLTSKATDVAPDVGVMFSIPLR